MTEDQAKTKWCPHAIASHTDPRQVIDGHWRHNCIASECMAWRTLTIPEHQEDAYNRKTTPDGDGWKPHSPSPTNLAWWRTIPERHIGYCGLAGAPQ